MHYVMFGALSAVAALLFGPVSAWLNKQSASVQNTQAQKFFGSFLGRTAVTTTAFFLVLIAAASVMSLLGARRADTIPTVG